MQFISTGFVTGKAEPLEYLAVAGGNPNGIFNGTVRMTTPVRTGGYGLTFTKDPPLPDLSNADIISYTYIPSYLYGKSGVAAQYFSGTFGTPSAFIYETCHGVRNHGSALQNFYNAPYRYGFFETWGENKTRTVLDQNLVATTDENNRPIIKRTLVDPDRSVIDSFGGSLKVTLEEYHQLNGIVSVNCGTKPPEQCSIGPGSLQHFQYFYYDCPSDIDAKSPSWQEAEVKWVPGNGITYKGDLLQPTFLFGGRLYNNSAIPTSMDLYGNFLMEDVCEANSPKMVYNTTLCPALVYETDVSFLKGDNGLMTSFVANAIAGFGPLGLGGNGKGGIDGYGAGAQANGSEDWWFWHFVYEENADTFPFSNGSFSSNSRIGKVNDAVPAFNSSIAWESWYWQHRLCPDYPKFLPWTFGANIFAAPETYFEVPYYSAIGKFGFYGMRFLNSHGSLLEASNRTFSSGCDDANNPIDNTLKGIEGDDIYDRLIVTSSLQKKYNDFFAGNKGLFLALNYDFLIQDPKYSSLSSSTQGTLKKLHDILWKECGYSGLNQPNLLSAWIYDYPVLLQDEEDSDRAGYIDINLTGVVESDGHFINGHTGYNRINVPDSYLYTNDLYNNTFWGQSELTYQDSDFIRKYSQYIVMDTNGSWNTGSYHFMAEKQAYISHKRALGHEVNGYPVDLFPLGRIYYSTDAADDYKKAGWATGYYSEKTEPPVPRRYFEGYYSNSSGVQTFPILQGLDTFFPSDSPTINDGSGMGFNAGFYRNINVGKMNPKRSYVPPTGGQQTLTQIITKVTRDFSGLNILGYNEIGLLDNNFSCFNPIFIQQPVDVICKIGQTPTFRALAVDYHTLPEDKLDGRWPEIDYWAKKLKLYDNAGKLLYPLSYKWGRMSTGLLANYNLGNLSGVQWANKTGDWCSLEPDGHPNFTLIHPKLCHPVLTGRNYDPIPGSDHDFAKFVKGAIAGEDDSYFYFCVTSGRFGLRRSEPARLILDRALMLDMAFRIPSARPTNPQVVFYSADGNNNPVKISLSAQGDAGFWGILPDANAIPETFLMERRTPNAVGCLPSWGVCCSDNKKRGLGMVGYDGWTVTWVPPTIQDIPLLQVNWGRIIPYGGLKSFSMANPLTQEQGDALYGRTHLPKSLTGKFMGEYSGIPFDIFLDGSTKVSHWSVEESAYVTDDKEQGLTFGTGDPISMLYPPSEGGDRHSAFPTSTIDQRYGKGQWQFSNNLGLVKRIGYQDLILNDGSLKTKWNGLTANQQTIIKYGAKSPNQKTIPDSLMGAIKVSSFDALGGLDGGWRKSSVGRFMAYFVEGFSSFYSLCGNKKKEFIKNYNFLSAGLRAGNAGFQYAWIGQPNSSYLTRQTMTGPYAYFWRFNRNNRDKNGNGMPLGMYSYSTKGPYSMMYDLPAVYGLYLKSPRTSRNQTLIQEIVRIKQEAGQSSTQINVGSPYAQWVATSEFNYSDAAGDDFPGSLPNTTTWCGVPFKNGGSMCSGVEPVGNTDPRFCEYPNDVLEIANNPDRTIYQTPIDGIRKNVCFPPCLSLRYDQGIIPGGKNLTLFGDYYSLEGPRVILSDASYNGYGESKNKLGPTWTPWAQKLQDMLPDPLKLDLAKYQSINPCVGGGSDHCNYVTPTVWLGSTQRAFTNVSYVCNLTNNFIAAFG